MRAGETINIKSKKKLWRQSFRQFGQIWQVVQTENQYERVQWAIPKVYLF